MLLGSGIENRGALYTSGVTAEEERRRTLLTLIDLAQGFNPGDCWDDNRAMDLLRSQSSPDELRELGLEEAMIAHIFPEGHVR